MDDLLPLLCCPVSGDPLSLEGTPDEGTLVTPSGRRYPIWRGVPRLLPPDLLHPFLEGALPDWKTRWPGLAETLGVPAPPDPVVLEMLTGYSFQHVDMADADPPLRVWRETWDRFQPGVAPEDFAGEAVIEIGCGAGRHAYLVAPHARLLVGLDLSRGVEVARAQDPRSSSHYIQADLTRPPFRLGTFDALYSNGVLHHTPDPAYSFATVARLVRSGGRTLVWVYGLDEMRWTYRLSHLTWIRPLTNRLPRGAQVAIAAGLTAGLSATLWTPARLLKRVGLGALGERIPYHDASEHDFRHNLRRVFDRLNPPITHYISRAELERWFADFEAVEIINAGGQGWSARGLKRDQS